MANTAQRVGFIVATRNRPLPLNDMLKSLEVQTRPPDRVIIVDSSDIPPENPQRRFPGLRISFLRHLPPSATAQRNAGIAAAGQDLTLLGFLDDDVLLEPEALERMLEFWSEAPADTAGAALNQINSPPVLGSFLKSLPMTEKLGLYSPEKGRVLPSGFQTGMGNVDKTLRADWLPTTAVLWRRRIFEEFRFDEWYADYSYLEDLDFSYPISKSNRLAVVAGAKYGHYPASSGRVDDFLFGRKEVLNRLYFVRKNQELSAAKCRLALLIRIFISLASAVRERKSGYLRRALGNLSALIGRTRR